MTPQPIFSDISNHWAESCITQLAKKQLVTGYPNGTFRPNSIVNRAEFAVLMLNAFPHAPIQRSGTTFKDVPNSHWAFKAVQNAYQRNFFAGYPGGFFQPHTPILRAQAIGVLAGALNYKIPPNPEAILSQYFEDAVAIPNYARNAIAAAAINTLIVNYPNRKRLNPLTGATRGEIAALLCRALNIYTVPPQYIAGVEVYPCQVRPLPGQLDQVPVFNSNSPELVETEGILLSTFPPQGKQVPSAHLNYAFSGRFDIFSHHIARAETPDQLHPLYQGIVLGNATNQSVKVEVLQAASYLSTPEAPFIDLPDVVENPQGTVYSGPGSRVTSDILRGVRQAIFPSSLMIPPQQVVILMNLPISIQKAPASNGRSSILRLKSNGAIYLASLAMRAPKTREGTYRAPTLNEWQTLLNNSDLAKPRDAMPTPLDPPREPTVFGRVAGVSGGARWPGLITDQVQAQHLTIPESGKAISIVLGTVHLITLSTGQIQSATMLRRYPDTAYFAHSNYAVEYSLTVPLFNPTSQVKIVNILIQTPLKDEGGTDRLLFLNPPSQQIFFRGTVRVAWESEQGQVKVRYVHLVQRRGQPGEPLLTLNLPPKTVKKIQVDLIYPPDSTPPQVLTVKTV